METKIIAIAVAAVVVVAAVSGVIFFMNNNGGSGSDGKDFDDASGALLIYGNANEDKVIDDKDLSAIQALIDKGEYEKIADANQDGKVDSDDKTFVEDMIAKKEMEIYYKDMTDGTTGIDYPVKSFMGVHQFVLMPMMAIGALQYMKGYTLSSNGVEGAPMLQELYDKHQNCNTSYNMVDVEKLSNLPEKPEFIFTYSKTLSNENKLEKSGIQVVHLDFSDFKGSMSAILTAGYLVNLSEKADEYVKFINDVVNDLDAKVLSKLTQEQKKTVICGYMTNCIDHKTGTYTPIAEAAGAVGVMKNDENTYVEFNRGDEWILSYNEDVFFYMNSWSYSNHIDVKAQYDKSADYFTGLKSYKSGHFYVFNSILPPAVIGCYMAEMMYPDLVGAGYGNTVNQDYLDKFFPAFAAGYSVSDYDFYITYDMAHPSA